MSDLKDELEQERRKKEWAETWTPDSPGDMLIGTLEAYDQATTDFGEYTVAHIRDEKGVLRGLWLMHSVLQGEWDEADPGVGERVGVQYLGKRDGKDFSYHMWTVKVDRPDEQAEDETPQESAEGDTAAAGNDRQPQGARSTAGANTEDAAPGNEPDGREQARQIYGGSGQGDAQPAVKGGGGPPADQGDSETAEFVPDDELPF